VIKKDAVKETRIVTRDQILSASDRIIEKVEVPEWGGHLYVRNMTAAERVEYDRWNIGENGVIDTSGVRIKAVIMCACDEKGVRMFTRENYDALSQRDGAAVIRIFIALTRINGLGQNSLAEAIEKLKNSPPSSSPTA
jgi:hypothetical protein